MELRTLPACTFRTSSAAVGGNREALLFDPLTAGGASALLTVIPILGYWPLHLPVNAQYQRII